MPATTTGNSYEVCIVIGDTNFFLEFPTVVDATDEFVLALISAIKGVTVPAGMNFEVYSASKTAVNNTAYNYDGTTTPPSFD